MPCVNALPVGWTFVRLEANEPRKRFWLGSDRGGERAVSVAVDRVCDLGTARHREHQRIRPGRGASNELDGSARISRRALLPVPGGCMTYHFDIHEAAGASAGQRCSTALGFVSRDTLRKYVHDYSDGRFELDPPTIGDVP